jgi:hypothetical protein
VSSLVVEGGFEMQIFLNELRTKDISFLTNTMTKSANPNAFGKVSIIPVVIDQLSSVSTKFTTTINRIGTFRDFHMFATSSYPSLSNSSKNLFSVSVVTSSIPFQMLSSIDRVSPIPSPTIGIVTIFTNLQSSIVRFKRLSTLRTDRQVMSPSKEIAKKYLKVPCIKE